MAAMVGYGVRERSSTMRFGVSNLKLLLMFKTFESNGKIVLTLPAFQWLKVDSSHLSARVGHTCHVVGNSQLLSIGGVDAAQTDPWSTVDHAFQGLGTFDLNNWNWTKSYNASAPKYKRNNALGHYYKDK